MAIRVQLKKNGPYIVEGKFSLGESGPHIEQRAALCRCGESDNKPLCDGTHKRVGFQSEDSGTEAKRQRYDGEDVSVSFSPSVCIHSAHCVQGAPTVFNVEQEPWVQPDAGTTDQIAKTVAKCPTGALRYSRRDGKEEQPDDVASVQPIPDGPYFLRGEMTIASADGHEVGEGLRIALCRCGQSKNRPFCDGTHNKASFNAP